VFDVCCNKCATHIGKCILAVPLLDAV
jgi:hypothetical protein